MRANVSRVSSFYMQGEKDAILLLAHGQFADQNRERGYEYKTERTVRKMRENRAKFPIYHEKCREIRR